MITKKLPHIIKSSPRMAYFKPSIIAVDNDVDYNLYHGITTIVSIMFVK